MNTEVDPIPVSPNLNTQLANAVASVARAGDRLESVLRRMRDLQKEANLALDAVDREQAHFDRLVEEVKKSAPSNSRWAIARLTGVKV